MPVELRVCQNELCSYSDSVPDSPSPIWQCPVCGVVNFAS